jgi:hypothetical protein
MRIRLAAPIALALVASAVALSAAGSGAAASSPLRRCAPQGYGLARAVVPSMTERPDSLQLTAGWLTAKEGRRSCLLRTTVRVTISDADGVEARSSWSIRRFLYPWAAVVHTWEWRNWCKSDEPDAVTITFSLPDGTTRGQRISSPPACVDATAPTTLVDVGTGKRYVKQHEDPIPAQMLPAGTPPPIHYVLIDPVNAWIASDGFSLTTVYAGSAGHNPTRGVLAISRQKLIFGVEYLPPDFVSIANSGALKITSAPQGVAAETTGQRGVITFRSARGVKGFLDLRGDRVHITSTP